MHLPDLFNSGISLKNELLKLNRQTNEYGLLLKPDEVTEVMEERKRLLREQGRVELDTEIIKLIIIHLSHSPYISQDNYLSTIIDLQEIFYYFKNETRDRVSDRETMEIIIDLFNGPCAGSIELLRGRGLDDFFEGFSVQLSNLINSNLRRGNISNEKY